MRLWIDAALSILFAPSCASCTRLLPQPSAGAVCAECWQSICPVTPPLCDSCGDALLPAGPARCLRCLAQPPLVERSRAIGIYDGSLRAIVHALKYDGRRSLAPPLAALMAQRGAEVVSRGELVVPVPLHRSRLRERGFNQSDDLARGLGLPVVRALYRTRRTAVQADLSAADRLLNVAGAFAPRRAARLVARRVVVLVDDVSTTGATLNACASVLHDCGASSVLALTAARAVTRWP